MLGIPFLRWSNQATSTAMFDDSVNPLLQGATLSGGLFWALALYRSGEYAKASVPMMNEVRGAKSTLVQSKERLDRVNKEAAISYGRSPQPPVWWAATGGLAAQHNRGSSHRGPWRAPGSGGPTCSSARR